MGVIAGWAQARRGTRPSSGLSPAAAGRCCRQWLHDTLVCPGQKTPWLRKES